ncbi:MAG: hypothetical protein QOK04_932 [Solirubrobacteraceae bacterium]|nr:hypothetical protein [Solirubrobacteraceae bacterium]
MRCLVNICLLAGVLLAAGAPARVLMTARADHGAAAASRAGPRAVIRLSVTPSSARVGQLVRLRFTVHSSAPRCRRGVTISFEGKRVHTNRHGRTALALRLGRSGRHRASAHKRGCRAGFASVRVTAHGGHGSGTAKTWYVSAAAGNTGDGSRHRPFGTLAAAESAAAAREEIVVLPSAASVPALEGGIALKAGQKLVGGGPPVAGVSASASAPRIANSSSARHAGDAIVLADGVEVFNIAVVGAYRGGIYGSDVKGVSVHGNDVTATNSSCTTGFIVQPFVLPTSAPGVGAPFSSGLSNGWAAIMVDESHTTTNVSINGNFVHDANCADGIDVRASGTANITAHLDHNTLTRLRQDASKESELAIGMQTTDNSRLVAEVISNTETYIGTATAGDFGQADSEGVFANAAGRSHLVEHVNRNTFAHGLGHLSANCVEMAASNGGPTMEMTLTNSTCDYVVGDIIEAANLSKDATMTLSIDHVRASHSTFAGAQAQAPVLPGDDGDCLLQVASGSASTTSVSINHSQFTDCVADGLGVVSNVVDGTGPVKKISFDVRNSRIAANQLSNLHVANVTEVTELDGRIENTDLSGSAGTPLVLEQRYGGSTTRANFDLGGGSLGSNGHNCIYGGAQTDATTMSYDLSAKYNWWGSPQGPAPGRTLAINGTITSSPALTAAPPPVC